MLRDKEFEHLFFVILTNPLKFDAAGETFQSNTKGFAHVINSQIACSLLNHFSVDNCDR